MVNIILPMGSNPILSAINGGGDADSDVIPRSSYSTQINGDCSQSGSEVPLEGSGRRFKSCISDHINAQIAPIGRAPVL